MDTKNSERDDGIDGNTVDSLQKNMENFVGNADRYNSIVKPMSESKIREQVEAKYKEKLKIDIEKELRPEIKEALRGEVESEVVENFKDEQKREIREECKVAVEREIYLDAHSKFEEKLQEAIEKERLFFEKRAKDQLENDDKERTELLKDIYNQEKNLSFERRAMEEKYNTKRIEIRGENRRNLMSLAIYAYIILIILALLYILGRENPSIYKINDDVLDVLHKTFNTLILIVVPFFFGALGAITRLLISGINIIKSVNLIISSSLMAVFSWITIKSGLFAMLLIPYAQNIVDKQEVSVSINTDGTNNFYSIVLVSVLVGMFSSNLYIYINEKVEALTKNIKEENKT